MQRKELASKALKGSYWVSLRVILILIINITTMAILARQLEIEDFGLVAMANIVINVFNSLSPSQGIQNYIIQDNDSGAKERAKSAYWLYLIVIIIIVIIAIVSIPWIEQYFSEPALGAVVMAMLLALPINGIIKIFDAQFSKKIEFKFIEIRDTVTHFSTAILSISMALLGYGVWSLIIPAVLIAFIKVLITVVVSDWRPGWKLYTEQWSNIVIFNLYTIGNSIIYSIQNESPRIAIVKILGTGSLGIYFIALQLSTLVSRTYLSITNKLLLPILSKVSEDKESGLSILKEILGVTTAFTFPILICLMVLSEDVIIVLYGDKWFDSVIILQILLINSIRFSATSPISPYFISIGRPDALFKVGLYMSPFYIIGAWYGSLFGMIEIVSLVTIVRIIHGLLIFNLAAKTLKINVINLISSISSQLFASIIAGCGVYILKLYFIYIGYEVSPIRLLLLTIAGVIIYYTVVVSLFRNLSKTYAHNICKIIPSKSNLINNALFIKNHK